MPGLVPGVSIDGDGHAALMGGRDNKPGHDVERVDHYELHQPVGMMRHDWGRDIWAKADGHRVHSVEPIGPDDVGPVLVAQARVATRQRGEGAASIPIYSDCIVK